MNTQDEERIRREEILTLDGGIFHMFEGLYIEAITYSAGRAEDAFSRLDTAIKESREPEIVIAIAHEALTHVAGLSKFFWPARNENPLYKARGKKLRSAFGIDKSSALYNRELRNALEHFDERLDDFLLQDRVGNFYAAPTVGSISTLSNLDFVFRFLDTDQKIFVLFGKEYPFGSLRDAINEILRKTEKMKTDGWQFSEPDIFANPTGSSIS